MNVSEEWKLFRCKQNARIGERNEGILDGSAIIVDLRGIQSLRRKYPPDLGFERLFDWRLIGQEGGILQNKKRYPSGWLPIKSSTTLGRVAH